MGDYQYPKWLQNPREDWVTTFFYNEDGTIDGDDGTFRLKAVS